MVLINKALGRIREVVEPARRRPGDTSFIGYILSEQEERIFFHSRGLSNVGNVEPQKLVNRFVAFDAISEPGRAMRKAINIDLLSGA